MKNIIAAIVLSATAIGANAASFDCTKATTKSEKFICANESISALDSKLHEVYVKAVKIDPSLKQEQRNWNKTVRDTMINIGQIQPLEAVYNAQIQNLMNVLPKEETASESDSETSAKVEEEQPKQEAKVVEEQKKEEKISGSITYQCIAKFTWKIIDGIETDSRKDPLYGNSTYGNKGGKLKMTMTEGELSSFVYVDEREVFKSNLTRSKQYKNMVVGMGKPDAAGYFNEYKMWVGENDEIRFEVIEKGHISYDYGTQYVCEYKKG